MNKGSLHILIADDDEGDRKLLKRILQKSGFVYECTEVLDINSAVKACKENSIDCAIIDYQLPGQDGLTGISILREQFPGMAIIMSTGQGSEVVAAEAFKRGALDYIVKRNLDQEVLKKALSNVMTKLVQDKERNKKKSEIEYIAYHDYLTNLPNRLEFENTLLKMLANAKRHQKIFSLMLIDLDGFKTINDTFGHAMGDSLLKQVAKRFKSVLREEDMLGRLGGDEFGVLIEDFCTGEEVGFCAQKLLKALSNPILLGNYSAHVTASIGVATYPYAGKTAPHLMQNADKAMYKAKKNGKNNFQFYKLPS